MIGSGDRMVPLYKDRRHAGEELARALAPWRGTEGLLVLGLPRGGVPVAVEVADRLDAPLDVLIVRKLGVPGHEELAMGAIAAGGVVVRNEDVIGALGVDEAAVERAVQAESAEVARRQRRYRGERPPPDLAERVVVLVDDGLATGATMRAAVAAARSQHPRAVVVAVPVGAADTCESLRHLAHEVVCPHAPPDFRAVGWWYEHFDQTSDDEVRRLLDEHWT
jgi:predicted phosphoribosyltransferase